MILKDSIQVKAQPLCLIVAALLVVGLIGPLPAPLAVAASASNFQSASLLAQVDARASASYSPAGLAKERVSLLRQFPQVERSAATAPPLSIQVKKLTASDGMIDDRFGAAIAVDGDIAMVGAYKADIDGNINQGAAYIFARNQGGTSENWDFVKKLVADDGTTSDGFGISVAISGDTIVVGSTNGAYIFARNQGGADQWGQVKKLTASGDEANFGYSLAIDGDIIGVGAPGPIGYGSTNQGAIYVFARNQGGADNWGEIEKLTAPEGETYSEFGICVALSGDTIVARVDRHYPDPDATAYIFARDQGGAGNWGFVKELGTSHGDTIDLFGVSAAIGGDTLVLGAWSDASYQGAAYVFARNQGGADNWGQVTKLTAADGEAGDYFGQSVAVDGDTIVIGASRADSIEGAAYVFARNQGGADNWGQVQKLIALDGVANDYFGWSVDISSGTIVANGGGHDSLKGAAYVYEPAIPIYLPTILKRR